MVYSFLALLWILSYTMVLILQSYIFLGRLIKKLIGYTTELWEMISKMLHLLEIYLLVIYSCSHTHTRARTQTHKSLPLRNFRDIVQKIDSDILKYSLAIHAWDGTDTTSSVYGHGKCLILKTIQRSQDVNAF